MQKKLQKGQLLIELILTMALAAIILPALLTGLVASREGKAQQGQRVQAIGLLKETEEAVRSVRNSSWSNIATNGTYHPVISGSLWTLSANAETVDTYYTRQVVISDVSRDSSGAIVTSGGTVDPSTKRATITISWTQPHASSLVSTMYFTRNSDLTYTETTQAQFTAGTRVSTSITNASGGEVTLGAGQANWCSPQNAIVSTLTLPKQGRVVTAKQGEAFVGTGDGTAGAIFVDINVNTPIPPATPSASIISSFAGTSQTNAIYSDGTYAYLAINGTSNQVLILNIASQPFTQIGTISVPSGANANGIYVANNIAFVTSSNKLYTVDVTNKSGSHSTIIDQENMWIGLGNTPLAKQVVVSGNKAYVGTSNTLFGLQVFKFNTGGSSLKLVGVSNWTIFQSAQGLALNSAGTRAYTAFNDGPGSFPSGFYIVNISEADPPAWWPLPNFYNIVGSYNSGATNTTGMAIAPGSSNKALLVGTGGTYQYHVINITNESSPTLCGGLAIGSGITGVTGVEDQYNNVYSYLISNETADQFKIVQGGEGGGNYAGSGTFESSAFDVGYSAAFNRFSATITQPAQTTIQMQIATAAPVGGSCSAATYTFVGPNGSTSSYFTPSGSTISAQVPLGSYGSTYVNPARCFKYKVWFSTSNTNSTPLFSDITLNYSP